MTIEASSTTRQVTQSVSNQEIAVPMNDQSDPQDHLVLSLDSNRLAVSYLSSLLRLVQAAVREVARLNDDTRAPFDEQTQPVLILTDISTEGDLSASLVFVDGIDYQPMSKLSARVFDVFMDRFGDFLKTLPQPGLWGRSPRGSVPIDSDVARRMNQLRAEMRRHSRVGLSLGERSVLIEGDRVEIS